MEKKAILIDDSIVRGDTLKKVVKLIREAGAKEVHVRITDAPIKFPCFYGIDMSTYSELIANRFSNKLEENIAKDLGVDSFVYQTFEGLIRAIGLKKEEICHACLTGEYTTKYGKIRAEELKESKDKAYIDRCFCGSKDV
jgi:amidophosphoribosyltransferase